MWFFCLRYESDSGARAHADLYSFVVFVCICDQDGYVPLHSSRITNCLAATNDPKRGTSFSDMLRNLLEPLVDNSGRTLVRADVHFAHHKVPRTFNSFVGRAAHLEFLETDVYLRFLLWTHRDYLR